MAICAKWRKNSKKLKIAFLPKFIKKYNSLDKEIASEVFEKIELFKDIKNHSSLKVHKLHGRFSDFYSFYVNFKIRITFKYISKKEVVLMTIGGHEVYR